ncbi:MAG: transposase [Thermoleophilia bacterium]
MTEYQITLNGEQVKELLVNDEGLKGVVEEVLNQVLKEQQTEQIGADRHERTENRTSYRNGFRPLSTGTEFVHFSAKSFVRFLPE